MEKTVSFEFCHSFPTYCTNHVRFKQKGQPKPEDNCGICFQKLAKKKKNSFVRPKVSAAKVIRIPCCKNSWFHRACLQTFASSAGLLFKCPLCNDQDVCRVKLPQLGIFIPHKDADWEFDATVYQDGIESVADVCEAETCTDRTGFSDAPWLWKICSTCGASAVHKTCTDDPTDENAFVCAGCTEILSKPKTRATSEAGTESSPTSSEEENVNQGESAAEAADESFDIEGDAAAESSDDEGADVNVEHAGQREKSQEVKSATKFQPWFSDDEQATDDEEDSENVGDLANVGNSANVKVSKNVDRENRKRKNELPGEIQKLFFF